MIHGLPAESVAAAIYAAKGRATAEQPDAAGPQAAQTEEPAPGEGRRNSAHRLAPPDPLDPKARAKQEQQNSGRSGAADPGKNGQELSPREQAQLEELEARDREVRRHEQAHIAAGTGHIVRGAQFSYQQGPDGGRYAVGGDVHIDVSPVPGDPEATIEKARKIYTAALAPAQPSTQDRQVAARAMQMKTAAWAEALQAKASEAQNSRPSQPADASPSESPDSQVSPETTTARTTRVNLIA